MAEVCLLLWDTSRCWLGSHSVRKVLRQQHVLWV